ncbi:dihydrofolate reductase family protein [Allokutzneria oryzae]|uniref:Dihydrofolate reductase family protein n=1 Tax=Allokutzneria oryzae TaxID=1378989 RepID=A0ABV5ZT78_9PSEU
MRKLTYYIATTLDGFISGPDGSIDFFPMEGDHIQAIVEEFPETIPGHLRPHLGMAADTPNRTFDTVVMGRGTYDPALTVGVTSPYPHLRQVVFSRSLAPRNDVEVVAGDPVAKIRELKQEDGLGIWLCGGGNLAAQLREEIDELVLKVNPVICGSGTPLFAGGFHPGAFTLTGLRQFGSGVVKMRYATPR